MRTTISRKRADTFYPKACPKCSGDMYKGSDLYGEFISCYQCGFEMAEPKAVVKPLGVQEKPSLIPEDLFEESA